MKINTFTNLKIALVIQCLITAMQFKCNAQTGWVQVPTPDQSASRNMLRGISGTSPSDIWTVGSYQEQFNFPPFYKQNDLIMHWNGSGWTTYPALNLSNTLDDLWDVESISPTDVWAVGIFNGASDPRPEILHFDGSQWTTHNPPNITGGSGLFSLDALSATDIWAVGYKTASPTRPAYVRHYNGNLWNEVTVPPVGAYRNELWWVDAISPTDVWAGGFFGETTGDFHAMVMRWNGSTWQNVPLPSSITTPQSEILSVKAISANDVWAVGYYLAGGGFKLHWNGTYWTEMPQPNGGGGAFAAIASNDLYSVGGQIWHWNGVLWTVDDPLTNVQYPALANAVTLPNGEIWACGVWNDLDGNFHTLVYRRENTLATAAGQASSSHITIAPNPANRNLMISLEYVEPLRYEVVDIVGKVLMQGNLSEGRTTELELSDLANGTYFLNVRGMKFSETKKFVVVH